MIYFSPRSRGSQRQRSMLRRTRSRVATSLPGVAASAAFKAAYCGWVGSRPLRASTTSCRGSAALSKRILLRGIEVVVDDPPVNSSGLLHVAEREVGRQKIEALRRCGRHQKSRPPELRWRGRRDHSQRGSALRLRPAGYSQGAPRIDRSQTPAEAGPEWSSLADLRPIRRIIRIARNCASGAAFPGLTGGLGAGTQGLGAGRGFP